MNRVYLSLVESQLRTFIADFGETTHAVFYDPEKGALIHPGEFGGHRESLVRDLLIRSLPEAFGVSQGFVISPSGEVSTQCDIIVYSKHFAPVIRTAEEQRFFPIESVIAVGEVKSRISLSQLREACMKLAQTKSMRTSLTHPAVASTRIPSQEVYSASRYVVDHICTFLVAQEIVGDSYQIADAIDSLPGSVTPDCRVNLVLDMAKARCAAYKDREGIIWPYPVDADKKTRLIVPENLRVHIESENDGNLSHIKLFMYFVQLTITRATILFPDIREYWGWR